MRIVGGIFKGRRLQAPKNLPARPTTDYAKESLFNILQHEIDWNDTIMVDLYCGIGSISLEAISRGAKEVYAVDRHFNTIKWLKKTSEELEVADKFHPVKSDAMSWLKSYEGPLSFVFADPPYDYERYEDLIDTVCSKPFINQGLFVLEHRKGSSFKEHPNFAEERTYGEVRFTFFRS